MSSHRGGQLQSGSSPNSDGCGHHELSGPVPNGLGSQHPHNSHGPSPPPPPANRVATLTYSGIPAVCGFAAECGCGVPTTPLIPEQYHIEPSAQPYISLAELNDVAKGINSITADNFLPPCPIAVTHFCVPFLPICILACYFSRYETKLNEFFEHINRTMYQSRNCHW
jgi:hypothetical protein